MAKPNAFVFMQHIQSAGTSLPVFATRGVLLVSALTLAACTSTPLPQWPASPGTAPAHQTTASKNPSAPAPTAGDTVHITPIAPVPQLQALPYSAAVAQQFPEPAQHYQTPGLKRNKQFTSNQELEQLLRQISSQPSTASHAKLGILSSDNSQNGIPIYAIVATQAGNITPAAIDDSKHPTVMIIAGQRGTDFASTEAALVIAQELASNGLLEPLLAKINVIVVPRANPDGFNLRIATTSNGTDLKTDHLTLKTPEARFLAKLVREYRPAVLLDAGEFEAIEPALKQLNAVRANDVGIQYAFAPNTHEFITKAAREWMHSSTAQMLSQAGLRVDWISNATNAGNTFVMPTLAPTTLGNTASLKNIVSLQVDSRGSDLGNTHLSRRVYSLVEAMTAVLQKTAEHANDLDAINTFVGRDIASQACRSTFIVEAQPLLEQRTLSLIDTQNAQLIEKNVAWANSLKPSGERIRNTPCGYWLSANAQQAVEHLEMLGVTVQRIAEPSTVAAETYEMALNSDEIKINASELDANPGSYFISMNQPLAFLVSAALEPDTTFSYYRSGLVPHLTDAARITNSPQIVFEEE